MIVGTRHNVKCNNISTVDGWKNIVVWMCVIKSDTREST